MFIGMANKLMEDGVREVFASVKSNIYPEMLFEGKIIVLDISNQEEEDTARLCQVIFKYCWQKEVQKRKIKKDDSDRFVFLYCDEAQYFVTRIDPQFLSTAKSYKSCVCYMTQNNSGLAKYLGSNQMLLQSFIANFQLIVLHQNNDVETNKYATELIGRTEIEKTTNSESSSSGEAGRTSKSNTANKSKVWEYQL